MGYPISKNLQRLIDILGDKYEAKIIDGVWSLYRKINNFFDIEVTKCHRKGQRMTIFLWDISTSTGVGARIIEIVENVPENKLEEQLNKIVDKYFKLTPKEVNHDCTIRSRLN